MFALLIDSISVKDALDDLLSPSCLTLLLQHSNYDGILTYQNPCSETLVSLIRQTVSKFPDSCALEKGGGKVTYNELWMNAQKVAYLMEHVISHGDMVCVLADRSINWIIAAYSVLILGAVYVPIDPTLPFHLRNEYIQSLNSRHYLLSSRPEDYLLHDTDLRCFYIEELLHETCATPAIFPFRTIHPTDPAYVCFTSGSTGKPKPVLCTHGGLVAFQSTPEIRLHSKAGQRIAQVMSPAFDGSVHEIFSALSYGSTLILPISETESLSHLASASCALMTPTLAKAIDPEDFPSLKNVWLVGEQVTREVCDRWAGSKRLYNMYGPTEGTCGATITILTPGCQITIGSPNPSSRVYILDQNERLAPPGVTGQICIAGVQVSKGYLGRSVETKAKFSSDFIHPDGRDGESMYRTGDFGYWTSTGQVFCLGRKDRQVKLRGFRLDMNDIENRIATAAPQLRAVAVTTQHDWLVAMVEPRTVDIEAIRELSRHALQPQALPRFFLAVDELPKTRVGKTDYAAIANADFSPRLPLREGSRSSTEQELTTIWRDLLCLPKNFNIEPDMSFLALGGHSTLQLLLAERVASRLQIRLPLRRIITSSVADSLVQMARLIETLSSTTFPSVESPTTKQVVPEASLTPPERIWFYRYLLDDSASHLNVSLTWALDPLIVDCSRLARAWDTVLFRHAILQSTYVLDCKGEAVRKMNSPALQAQLLEWFSVDVEINKPFTLQKGPLLKVLISPSRMMFCASHIICDLTAALELLREVTHVYKSIQLRPLSRTYMQSDCWNWRNSEQSLHFWQDAAGAAINTRKSRLKNIRRPSCRGSSVTMDLGLSLLQSIDQAATQFSVTRHQIALTAVTLVLQEIKHSASVLLGGPFINRSLDDAQTVGLFLEPLMIPVGLPEGLQGSNNNFFSEESVTLLRSIQKASQDALANALPWEQFLEHFELKLTDPSHLLFDAMVTFHSEQMVDGLNIPGVELSPVWPQGSKFRLMFELTPLSDEHLHLRVEYMEEIFSKTQVEKMGTRLLHYLSQLSRKSTYARP